MANDFFDVVMPFLRKSNHWYPMYAVFLVLAYIKKGFKFSILMLVLASIGIFLSDFLIANQIKHLVQRLRPCNNPMMHARLVIEHCGSGFSFISAHACNHFMLAIVFSLILNLYHKKLSVIALLWATMISFAQVYVGVHYPFDVICGAILGCISGIIVINYIYPYLANRYNI